MKGREKGREGGREGGRDGGRERVMRTIKMFLLLTLSKP